MNRFLGIGVSFTWDRERGSCKASAVACIERVAQRFGLEDTRTHATPMEAGFEITLKLVRAILFWSSQRKLSRCTDL